MVVKLLILLDSLLWLVFVISDAVILGILNLIGIIITLIVNSFQNRKIKEVTVQQKEMTVKQDEIKIKQAEIGVQIDGKIDKLLEANKRADIAEGTATGRAEVHTEQAIAKQEQPIEVIVINPESTPVPVKSPDKKD